MQQVSTSVMRAPWVPCLLVLCCSLLAESLAALEVESALCPAVADNNVAQVKALLKQTDIIAAVDKTCFNLKTPLVEAAINGYVKVGELLIDNGANINQSNFLGQTPLLRAAENFEVDFMRMLIDRDADMYAKVVPIVINKTTTRGIDIMTLATAAYLGTETFMNADQQIEFTQTYHDMIDLLYDSCFDLKTYGQVSQTRLTSENHVNIADYLATKEDPPPDCTTAPTPKTPSTPSNSTTPSPPSASSTST